MKLYYTSEVQGIIEGRNVMYPNADGELWIIAKDEDDAYKILCDEISDIFDDKTFEYYLLPADDEMLEQFAEDIYECSFEDLCSAITVAKSGLHEYLTHLLPDVGEAKREWIEDNVGSVLAGLDDLAYDFYYKAMHDNGMDLSDADRYAWLNMLFGYDIGAEHAAGIINWYYERDLDVMDIVGGLESKSMMMNDVEPSLGYHLDYRYWAWDEPEYISFKYMAVPKLKMKIDNLKADGVAIDDICGCICGLFHEGVIDEAQEAELYMYADPEDTMDIAPFEAWMEFQGGNLLS